jgi:hypothetical protein
VRVPKSHRQHGSTLVCAPRRACAAKPQTRRPHGLRPRDSEAVICSSTWAKAIVVVKGSPGKRVNLIEITYQDCRRKKKVVAVTAEVSCATIIMSCFQLVYCRRPSTPLSLGRIVML